MSSRFVSSLRRELQARATAKYRKAQEWFFKEPISLLGVRVGDVRRIGNRFYKELPSHEKKDVFVLAEKLLAIDCKNFELLEPIGLASTKTLLREKILLTSRDG